VYGTLLGQASEKHVRAAIKKLHDEGLVGNDGKGKDFYTRPVQGGD
jgi:hypothetical protein